MGKNHRISAPPIHKLFDLKQNDVPWKIRIFMKIYVYENKRYSSKWKTWKKSILLFSPMSRRRVM